MAVHETIFFKAFQFTPLREGRHDAHRRGLVGTISIHAPPRGATGLPICAVMALSFQFTPLREGRLNGALTSATVSTISIHAPPRGATSPLRTCSAQKNCISIHAPPRGATRCSRRKARACADFNSRPSARGDKVFRITSDSRDIFQFTPLREGRLA